MTIIENTVHISFEIGGGVIGTRSIMNEIRNEETHKIIDSWVEIIED